MCCWENDHHNSYQTLLSFSLDNKARKYARALQRNRNYVSLICSHGNFKAREMLKLIWLFPFIPMQAGPLLFR